MQHNHEHHTHNGGNHHHCGHEHCSENQKAILIRVILALILFGAGFYIPQDFKFAVYFTAYAIAGWDVVFRAVKNIFKVRYLMKTF